MTKTVKNETRGQKGGFLSMLLRTLGASLLGDLLTKNLSGKGTVRAREGFLRAGEGIKKEKRHDFKKNDDLISSYFK